MFEKTIATLVDIVCSPALIFLCLVTGLVFSIAMRFLQLRRIKEMCLLLFKNDKTEKMGVSSFQAFSMAISGRVGTGNIVGVASAIGFGGPGAIFWMWIIAFLGASSAFVESTLAQVYKTEVAGEYRGGPSYYMAKGLNCKWLATVFAICSIVACGFLLPTIQSNSVAEAFQNSMHIGPLYTGIVVALFFGLVIVGGVKRIANVAQIVAPFMALLYMIVALVVVLYNIPKLPDIFTTIFQSAFGVDQIFGGILGSTIMWGVKRGIFSNEAGQGTGPIVAAAAKVSHPVKQGLVQSFSVYVDTLLVCTATAIMILSTGMYNVVDANGAVIYQGAAHLTSGNIEYTQAAVETILPYIGKPFVAISLLFFAFTTLLAYYYYAETSVVYIVGKRRFKWLAISCLRILMMLGILFGSVKEALVAWRMGDIGVGVMAWINIVVIWFLFPKVWRILRDYEQQQKAGIDPVFDPRKLGIKNADFWEKRLQESDTLKNNL